MLVAEPLGVPVLRVKCLEIWIHLILSYERDTACPWYKVTTVGSHVPNKLCHGLFLRFHCTLYLLLVCSWKQLPKF